MPRNAGVFIHPGFVQSLRDAGHYSEHTCTIQVKGSSRNAVGEQVEGWVNVTGMVDLPCMAGQPRTSMQGREMEQTSSEVFMDSYLIYFDRVLPGITVDDHRVMFEDKPYDIINVDNAPNGSFTWLAVERVT